ncbi:ABC transporter substrate-binding protein [Enterovirga sp. CN4-39]|uniref:ABC transporter substrate-binding protein n=1 Tax=Enterovirga sp. CN4-39 TaxID=3400910 RepID=UPI003BFFFF99
MNTLLQVPRAYRKPGATGRLLAVVLSVVVLSTKEAPAVPQHPAPSVISINLCTDQLVVALADPSQIFGLSRYAGYTVQSAVADRIKGLRLMEGTAEEILIARPDYVFAGRYTKRSTRALLRQKGLRVMESDSPRSIEDARAQIAEVGRLLGHNDGAEHLLDRIDQAVSRARSALPRANLKVLNIQRRGWVSGESTLLSSLLDTVGLANEGGSFSSRLGRFASLEEIIASKAEVLILPESARGPQDQGAALLEHPALAARFPPNSRIRIPDRFLFCGGAAIIQALDLIVEQVRLLSRP